MVKYLFTIVLSIVLTCNAHSQQIVEDIGHYTQIGLPLTALGISLAKGDMEGSVQFAESIALQTGLVIILKRSINRERPNGRPYSFPSGHTAVSFMSSTYLWKRYGWEYGVPFTLLAGFVGFSRYGTDEPVHYFSDVVAGSIIGIGSSWLFTKRQPQKVEVDVVGDLSFVGLKLKLNLN
ncbi:MAG: phosphatase PAP2 family protein [Saprospiraceae bacterium]|nr:phosphatase PAP2 family protein [Saprospiraceae bacterium]